MYQPLSLEQFQKAKQAGYTSDKILSMEQKRKAQETPIESPYQEEPAQNNILQSAFTSLIGRPAIRASQAIAGGIVNLVGNEQQKQNYYNEIQKPVKLPMGLGTVEPQKAFGQGGVKQIAGNAAETATYLAPYGKIEGAVQKTASALLPKAIPKVIPKVLSRATAGAVGGYGFDIKANAEQDKPLFTPGINTVLGGGIGVVAPPIIGAISNKLFPTPALLNTKLDANIRDIFKGTTADVGKVNEMAFKARRGLELLNKESDKIQIPDVTAPLGSKITKPFNLQKSTPNELLSGVLEMDKKIASQARTAVGKATEKGIKIDTTDIEKMIFSEIENGKIQKATGKQMLKQIQATKNDPVAIHDWVQDVNVKYGKKYERGTIDDTATGKLADDIAEVLRQKLDSVVDRKGYAEAFGNNQELKRMLVAVAKKANKGVNFGNIATDAGLDLGISVLTGNPAYMARTVGSGLFRGILSKMRNTSGFRSFKKASALTGKLPTKTKLPSSRVKTPALVANEEFVKAQPKLYHGTAEKFDTFDDSMRGSITGAKSGKGAIWITDDPATAKAYSVYAAETGPINKLLEKQKTLEKIAQKSGKESDWVKVDDITKQVEELDKYDATYQRRLANANVKEVIVDGDFMKVDAKGKSPRELSAEGDIDSWLNEQLDKARKLGKDGVMFQNLDDAVGLYDKPSTHYAIFDSQKIKTKSQLTDIWNKAQETPTAVAPKPIEVKTDTQLNSKVFERMQARYNDYANNPNAINRVKFPQVNNIQPPTVAQRNINATTIGEGNMTKATPSITKTDQKLNEGVINNSILQSPKKSSILTKPEGTKNSLFVKAKEKMQDFKINDETTFYHGTSAENATKISSEGFKTGSGKGISGQTSNDFIYATENKVSAGKYVADRLGIKNPTTVKGSFTGKVLDIQGKMADFEAFGEASKKLGIPLGKDSQGKLSMLDMSAIKKAMKEQGYGAIRFSDRYANGSKSLAILPDLIKK